MLNWFDIMRQAQNGARPDDVSRPFDLTPDRMQAAVDAMIPMYITGMKYLASNPDAMAQFFHMMGNRPYPTLWESAARIFAPSVRRESDKLLDRLFSSDEVSRQAAHRAAHQAAAFSSIGIDIMQRTLPLFAGIVAGGIVEAARIQGAMFTLTANPPAEPAPNPTQPNPIGAWVDLWSRFMGLPPEDKAPISVRTAAEEAPSSPYEDMLALFLTPLSAQEHSAPSASPTNSSAEPEVVDLLGMWERIVETGCEMQKQHLASLQNIFDVALRCDPQRR